LLENSQVDILAFPCRRLAPLHEGALQAGTHQDDGSLDMGGCLRFEFVQPSQRGEIFADDFVRIGHFRPAGCGQQADGGCQYGDDVFHVHGSIFSLSHVFQLTRIVRLPGGFVSHRPPAK
jgi:hypothetical protein